MCEDAAPVLHSHCGTLFVKMPSWLGTKWWSHLSQFYFYLGRMTRESIGTSYIRWCERSQSLCSPVSLPRLFDLHAQKKWGPPTPPHPTPVRAASSLLHSWQDFLPFLHVLRIFQGGWKQTKPRLRCWKESYSDTEAKPWGKGWSKVREVKTGG